jgi:hypothetical protein
LKSTLTGAVCTSFGSGTSTGTCGGPESFHTFPRQFGDLSLPSSALSCFEIFMDKCVNSPCIHMHASLIRHGSRTCTGLRAMASRNAAHVMAHAGTAKCLHAPQSRMAHRNTVGEVTKGAACCVCRVWAGTRWRRLWTSSRRTWTAASGCFKRPVPI